MTFTQASQVITDNSDLTTTSIKLSNPPHMILDCFIAPSPCDLTTLGNIYNRIKENNKTNEDALLEMGLNGDNLKVYIVYLISGVKTFQALEDYKVSNISNS